MTIRIKVTPESNEKLNEACRMIEGYFYQKSFTNDEIEIFIKSLSNILKINKENIFVKSNIIMED